MWFVKVFGWTHDWNCNYKPFVNPCKCHKEN